MGSASSPEHLSLLLSNDCTWDFVVFSQFAYLEKQMSPFQCEPRLPGETSLHQWVSILRHQAPLSPVPHALLVSDFSPAQSPKSNLWVFISAQACQSLLLTPSKQGFLFLELYLV